MTDVSTIVSVYARSDPGRSREHNEDAFLIADLTTGKTSWQMALKTCRLGPRGLLFLVADGMGGAAAGELASSMAADLIVGHLLGTWAKEPPEAAHAERFTLRLREAVELANLQIHSYAQGHPEVRGMGTTATVAGILGERLYLAQVGDSRGYLVRGGQAVQLTKDQSLTQRLVDAGELTEEQAERSARRNIILQALGPDPAIRVDLTEAAVRQGDVLVLCSDGLSGLVKREEIAARLDPERDLAQLGTELINLANTRGGPDNITVVLARFEGAGFREPEADGAPTYHAVPPAADAEPAGETDLVPPAPAPVAAPERAGPRTGTPVGLALVFAGVILVLLALFLAATG